MTDKNEPIIAFAKNKNEHDYVTAGELLNALKGNVFSSSIDKAPILIHSFDEKNGEDDIHLLKIVYKCSKCNSLHLEAGNVKPEDIFVDENSIIYSDFTHDKFAFVNRKELIEILEKFISKNGEEKKVDIRTSDDESTFPLTQIFKCSQSCPSVHLTSGYYKESKK